jgi:hypothetical protein
MLSAWQAFCLIAVRMQRATLPDALLHFDAFSSTFFFFFVEGVLSACVCVISESKSTERVNRLSFHSTNHTLLAPFALLHASNAAALRPRRIEGNFQSESASI